MTRGAGLYEVVQSPKRRIQRGWVWPLALAALIFFASSQSKLAGPDVEGSDKVVHFSVYGLLATLAVRLVRTRRAAWLIILAVSLYGVSDEWHQSFTPGRSVEFADWLADTLGGAMAVLLYTRWSAYRRFLERPIRSKRQVEISVPVEPVLKS